MKFQSPLLGEDNKNIFCSRLPRRNGGNQRDTAPSGNQAQALREKVGALTATEERRVEQALREGAVCAAQQQPSQSTEREGGGTELCLFVPPCRYNVEGDVGSTRVKTPVPLKHLNIIMPKEEQASLSTDLYHN